MTNKLAVFTAGNFTTPIAMGWQCPRCHTINAPSAAKCVCMAPSQTTTTGNTYTQSGVILTLDTTDVSAGGGT